MLLLLFCQLLLRELTLFEVTRLLFYIITSIIFKFMWKVNIILSFQGRTSSLDVQISTFSMLTGLRMNQTVEFLKKMKVASGSRSTFYRIQKAYVHPIIWQTWTEMQAALCDELRGRELKVTGDGQYDSPGFTAYYCFYSLVESTTNKVRFSSYL